MLKSYKIPYLRWFGFINRDRNKANIDKNRYLWNIHNRYMWSKLTNCCDLNFKKRISIRMLITSHQFETEGYQWKLNVLKLSPFVSFNSHTLMKHLMLANNSIDKIILWTPMFFHLSTLTHTHTHTQSFRKIYIISLSANLINSHIQMISNFNRICRNKSRF